MASSYYVANNPRTPVDHCVGRRDLKVVTRKIDVGSTIPDCPGHDFKKENKGLRFAGMDDQVFDSEVEIAEYALTDAVAFA
jgi:hypothetical protein